MTGPDPARAREHHRLKRLYAVGDWLWGLVVLGILQAAGVSAALGRRLGEGNVALFLHGAALFFLLYAAALPVSYASGFALEHRFGLSRQTRAGWLADAAKRALVSLVFFLLTIPPLLLIIRQWPEHGWIAAGFGWTAVLSGSAFVFPLIILPLFYKTEALPAGALRARIEALFVRHRVPLVGIDVIRFSAKTVKANAAVVGLGKSRRVLLSDTLLASFPEDEIEMVVAHELGHHALAHVRQALLFHALTGFGGFWLLWETVRRLAPLFGFDGPGELGFLPVILFLLAASGGFFLPASNAFSRRKEREADDFAIASIPAPSTFASLLRRLGGRNLAEPEPPAWIEAVFYSHPHIEKRIRRIGSSTRT